MGYSDPIPDNPAAGGWGSLKAVTTYLLREHVPASGAAALALQNKPDGFMCVSCAWAKPAKPHPAEFCENGAKATAWELTGKRATAGVLSRAHPDRARRLVATTSSKRAAG